MELACTPDATHRLTTVLDKSNSGIEETAQRAAQRVASETR